ncbi:Bcspt7 [Botrytis cinerea B05.10]|uniref:Bcspt7 n=3 Tax=Botryotinia fuckeliana TaxID=40559 RepID=A0A384JB90_BOTFB|nr:Bcspt7 [Botrytis cinerea B05.10]ATZ47584.1 Bcspt7 [Botrytis cinerea B05.10]
MGGGERGLLSRSGVSGHNSSITNGTSWSPSSSNIMLSQKTYQNKNNTPPRSHTPSIFDATMADSANVQEEESQRTIFKELYRRSEAKLAGLFGGGDAPADANEDHDVSAQNTQLVEDATAMEPAKQAQPPKKPARAIDEDNYDDDDEDDEDEPQDSPSKARSANALLSPSKSGSSPIQSDLSPSKNAEQNKDDAASDQPKTSEDARKKLEEEKKAVEDAAKRSFNTIFYTLENDRIAMLEQQRLEESERQTDAEMNNNGTAGPANNRQAEQHSSLASAEMGASSLTLKNLFARIDAKRDRVQATDLELRALINEVRKNRSKWASEDNVNQEELYEAADKVLSELKAMTEYSAPFLVRVNKREAPDYYNVIKHPMDLGTMTKKLKQHLYRSKSEFVADLDLIWENCLNYNGADKHPLRRNAENMRKEAAKLIPLIPDLVIRPRAEVEAEERRKQNGGDDADESDDEPIMSSRGRGEGGRGVKGHGKARKNTSRREETTPGIDQKPAIQLNGVLGNLNQDGSEVDGSQNGFSTPIPGGSVTPGAMNGVASQVDGMDIDAPSIDGMGMQGFAAENIHEDEEYKIWKQVTKKNRAMVAKDRNRLFKGDRLNPDEPALLRTKAGMRRWLRQRKLDDPNGSNVEGAIEDKKAKQGAETLAEGMEGEEEHFLPDYYDPLSAIPDINPRLQWVEDGDGNLVEQSEEFLRMVPAGHFTAPKSFLTGKVEANMKQMQETRKLCSKIGVIKQMQLQAQMYNNQFPKYEPEPFIETDIEPHVTSDDGPIMSSWVCRAAMQRSVAKLCYHAGFEELQPSALDVITDIAGDFFGKIVKTFGVYREAHKVPAAPGTGSKWQERYSNEEVVLHSLGENGMDIEALESYVKDDVERLGTKLSVMHERMKAHLTDLLRPALQDNSQDGSGAFNEGSEQFVGGDFAAELGEDYFGFKALGLDSEFSMTSLGVPLHLLHTRVRSAYQGPTAAAPQAEIFSQLEPLPPITKESITSQIGLVKNFFLAKLHANDDEPLLEDEELTGKQKPTRPRLGPTGKITSPRKRPLKEQSGNAKKKKKLDNGSAVDSQLSVKTGGGGSPQKGKGEKGKLELPNGNAGSVEESMDGNSPVEKDDGAMIPMSPESIAER